MQQDVSSGTVSHSAGWQTPQAHPSSPSLGTDDARTYLHLPCVIGNDEAQQYDGGEAYKAFQGQGEHGVLQGGSREGIKGYTAMGLCWHWTPHSKENTAPQHLLSLSSTALLLLQLPP